MALPVIGVGGKLTSPVLVKTPRFLPLSPPDPIPESLGTYVPAENWEVEHILLTNSDLTRIVVIVRQLYKLGISNIIRYRGDETAHKYVLQGYSELSHSNDNIFIKGFDGNRIWYETWGNERRIYSMDYVTGNITDFGLRRISGYFICVEQDRILTIGDKLEGDGVNYSRHLVWLNSNSPNLDEISSVPITMSEEEASPFHEGIAIYWTYDESGIYLYYYFDDYPHYNIAPHIRRLKLPRTNPTQGPFNDYLEVDIPPTDSGFPTISFMPITATPHSILFATRVPPHNLLNSVEGWGINRGRYSLPLTPMSGFPESGWSGRFSKPWQGQEHHGQNTPYTMFQYWTPTYGIGGFRWFTVIGDQWISAPISIPLPPPQLYNIRHLHISESGDRVVVLSSPHDNNSLPVLHSFMQV